MRELTFDSVVLIVLACLICPASSSWTVCSVGYVLIVLACLICPASSSWTVCSVGLFLEVTFFRIRGIQTFVFFLFHPVLRVPLILRVCLWSSAPQYILLHNEFTSSMEGLYDMLCYFRHLRCTVHPHSSST